jgi:NADPH:quinone reductase-like Zn-dependent oxidoreductase
MIQAAKAGGLEVTAAVSTRNVDLARSLGASEVVDYTRTDLTRAGRTYDAVLDLVGNRRLRELGRTVRPGGRLVLSGGGASGQGRLVGSLRLLLGAAAVARRLPFDVRMPQAVPSSASLERMAGLDEAGRLRPFVDRTFALAEAPEAIRCMETEHSRGTPEARSSSSPTDPSVLQVPPGASRCLGTAKPPPASPGSSGDPGEAPQRRPNSVARLIACARFSTPSFW